MLNGIIFRRIFGHVRVGGSIYNGDIYERCHNCLLVDKIRWNRGQWAGHLLDMGEDDPAVKSISVMIGIGQEVRQPLKISVEYTLRKIGGVGVFY